VHPFPILSEAVGCYTRCLLSGLHAPHLYTYWHSGRSHRVVAVITALRRADTTSRALHVAGFSVMGALYFLIVLFGAPVDFSQRNEDKTLT
jgi:hypothetical protein